MFGARLGNGIKSWRVRLLLTGGFLAGLFGLIPRPVDLHVRWSVPVLAPETYLPEARVDSGPEIVFVFIGSSQCRWSTDPEAQQLVRKAKLAVRETAHQRGHGFAAIGIARDMIASDGIEHLDDFGNFDETLAGRGWMNTGVMKYIYGDLPGPAATPQIVVVKRHVRVENGQRSIVDERVLTRKAGLVEIRKWVETGMALAQ